MQMAKIVVRSYKTQEDKEAGINAEVHEVSSPIPLLRLWKQSLEGDRTYITFTNGDGDTFSHIFTALTEVGAQYIEGEWVFQGKKLELPWETALAKL
jgi:hypothetical protein